MTDKKKEEPVYWRRGGGRKVSLSKLKASQERKSMKCLECGSMSSYEKKYDKESQ